MYGRVWVPMKIYVAYGCCYEKLYAERTDEKHCHVVDRCPYHPDLGAVVGGGVELGLE